MQEVLLPRLVRPEEGHSLGSTAAQCCGRVLRTAFSGSARTTDSLYPCRLTDDTDQALDVDEDLVKAWGDRAPA